MFNKVIVDGVLDAARISAFAFIMSVANDVTTFLYSLYYSERLISLWALRRI